MYKRVLALTFLLLVNTSTSAMDLNETTVIINEATKATEALQDEFTLLLNEVPTPPKVEVVDVNSSLIPIVEVIPSIETNETIELNNTHPLITEKFFDLNHTIVELNNSIDINGTILIEEINSSKKSSCNEINQSIIINGLNINLDENNTIADNGCTDANLGTSAEGLIIFKTRIKPYCEITGDKFAKQFMQEDWDDIYHDKEFKMEILKACPNMEDRYKDSWTPHLYQFTLEYASDSDAIPEC